MERARIDSERLVTPTGSVHTPQASKTPVIVPWELWQRVLKALGYASEVNKLSQGLRDEIAECSRALVVDIGAAELVNRDGLLLGEVQL